MPADSCPHCGQPLPVTEVPSGEPVACAPCGGSTGPVPSKELDRDITPFFILLCVVLPAIAVAAETLNQFFGWADPLYLHFAIPCLIAGIGALLAGLDAYSRNKRWFRPLLAVSVFLINLLVTAHGFSGGAEGPRYKPACVNNLKQLNLVFRMYANEHEGYYPPLSTARGRLTFETEAVYPEYLSDPRILICPSDTDLFEQAQSLVLEDQHQLIDDQSYFYLGYLVTSDAEMRAFAEAYQARVAAGQTFGEDLIAPEGSGNAAGDRLFRLREGVERHLIRDMANPEEAQELRARIPLMWERATLAPHETKTRSPHPKDKRNVIYLDGHVDLVAPGTWPYTEETMRILHDLDTP